MSPPVQDRRYSGPWQQLVALYTIMAQPARMTHHDLRFFIRCPRWAGSGHNSGSQRITSASSSQHKECDCAGSRINLCANSHSNVPSLDVPVVVGFDCCGMQNLPRPCGVSTHSKIHEVSDLSELRYAYVQVSPPQESVQGSQWWTDYQV
jgi:hypothetical protein